MIRNTCREALQYIGTHTHTSTKVFQFNILLHLLHLWNGWWNATYTKRSMRFSETWPTRPIHDKRDFFFFIVFQWVFLYFSLWPKHDFRTRILGLQNTPSLWSTLTRSIRHDCHSVVVEQKDSKPVLMMLSLSFAKCDFEIEFLLFWWDFC